MSEAKTGTKKKASTAKPRAKKATPKKEPAAKSSATKPKTPRKTAPARLPRIKPNEECSAADILKPVPYRGCLMFSNARDESDRNKETARRHLRANGRRINPIKQARRERRTAARVESSLMKDVAGDTRAMVAKSRRAQRMFF